MKGVLDGAIIAFGVYALLKFAFFFALPYATRRRLLDRQYAGWTSATAHSDRVLLLIVLAGSAAVLLLHDGPMQFLAGLLFGGTLVQTFFHAFKQDPDGDRRAPAPSSPIKAMSYAIQDKPLRAWPSMAVFAVLIVLSIVRYAVMKN